MAGPLRLVRRTAQRVSGIAPLADKYVEAGKAYQVGLAFPGFLNDQSESPSKYQIESLSKSVPATEILQWFTKEARDAEKQTRDVRCIRRHIGVVVRVTGAMTVILLGSSRPRQAHRFLPWHGTPRKDFQPLHHIRPTPLEAFMTHKGYLNFTHALEVRVLGPTDVTDELLPGFDHFQEHFITESKRVNICVSPRELGIIRQLHSAYWAGKRYNADGSISDFTGYASDYLSDEGDGSSSSPSDVLCGGYQSFGVDYEDPDPVDEVTGRRVSVLVNRAQIAEDIRATQVERMDPEFDLSDSDAENSCVIYPLSREALDDAFSSGSSFEE